MQVNESVHQHQTASWADVDADVGVAPYLSSSFLALAKYNTKGGGDVSKNNQLCGGPAA